MNRLRAIVSLIPALGAGVLAQAQWPAISDDDVEMPTPVLMGEERAMGGEVFTLLNTQTGMPTAVDIDELRQIWESRDWPMDAFSDSQSGYVPMGEAAKLVDFEWSADDAALVLSVPSKWMQEVETVSDGRSVYVRDNKQWVDPALVSGYLNLRGRYDTTDEGLKRSTARAETLINIHGIAWRSDFTHTEDNANGSETHLEHTSLSFEKGAYAAILGDWQVATRGLQSAPTITGLHFSKGVSRWSELLRGSADSFEVETRSTVEIWRDGQLVRSQTLEPGTYTYRELGIIEGDSTTQARLRDEAGEVKVLQPSVFSDILKQGEWAGSISIGLKRDRDDTVLGSYGRPLFDNSLENDSSNLIMHGFAEYGLGRGWEVEADWQSDTHAGRFGAGFAYDSGETESGRYNVRANAAATSHYDAGTTGYGFYGSATYSHPSAGTLAATGSYRSSDFANLGSSEQWGLSGSYSLAIGDWVHSLTASVNSILSTVSDSYRYSLTRRIGDFRLGGSVRYADNETEGLLTMSWMPRTSVPTRRYSVYGSVGSEGTQGTATIDQSSGQMHYGLAATGRYDADNSQNGKLYGYFANQYMTSSATASAARDAQGINSRRVTLTGASAVAFADNAWTITRPIQDSFILVKTHPTWKEQGMRAFVNPDIWGGHEGHTGMLPTVLSLQAHPDGNSFNVAAEGDGLLSLDRSDFTARTGPNRGGVLVVGDDAGTMIMGKIYLANGDPLAKTRIRLVHADGEVVSTFTTSTGRFSAGPIKAGLWDVETRDGWRGTFDTVIAEKNDHGIVELGKIVLRGGQPRGRQDAPASPIWGDPYASVGAQTSAE